MRSSPRSRLVAGQASFEFAGTGYNPLPDMVNPSDFRNGMTIEWEGDLWVVLEFQQGQNARGDTFFRTKLRNVRSGAIIDQKFRDKDRFTRARIEKVSMQYLYSDGDRHYFMDLASYDQLPLNDDQLGDSLKYLKENSAISVLMYDGQPLGVELPTTVDLKVTDTAPGFRGDTAAGGGKPATVETGLTLNVPFFVNEGDVIRVDTRSGAYVERV
jgi:elongation factor P